MRSGVGSTEPPKSGGGGFAGAGAGKIARLGAQALSLVLVVGLLGLLIWKVVHQTGSLKARVGKTAPSFALPRLDGGGELGPASFRGTALVVNFWASWCGPCRDEAPLLERAAKQYKGRLVVLGVDYQDFSGDAKRFVTKYSLTYPIVRDGNGKLLAPWGVTGAPESFFIDASGRLVQHIPGAVSSSELAAGIRKALAE